MKTEFTDEQLAIKDAIERICADFSADYWLETDQSGVFPQEFVDAICEGGWFGIAMPEEFGGSGMGITEASILCQVIAQSGAGYTGASSVHLNLFGLNPIVVFGSEEQKQRWLPPMIEGKDVSCFGVTEPNAGLDTTSLQVKAERKGDVYVISGQKHWTTMAQRANKVLLLARTTSKDEVTRKTDGLSLFYTDLNRDHAEIRVIEKMGRKAVDSNAVFYDDMPVPVEDLIGEEGKGFHYILHVWIS